MLSKQIESQIQIILSMQVCTSHTLDQFICLLNKTEHYFTVKMDYIETAWLLIKKTSVCFPRTH